ncbi:hypothetical protein CMI37_31390 [Candidatus Pacearchaeota archaeon]|nr:hypothetical protein [Candidatus Pacearchaeota archaeon]|tara:strand:+ start:3360 stop:5033 length:1674 start_codon:yes stop_codon:yes gene_type:complete
MAENAERIVTQYKRRVLARGVWESRWRSIAKFFMPHRSSHIGRTVGRTVTPGESQTEGLFDSTGIEASIMLAGFLWSGTTNPAIQWHSLKMRDDSLNRIQSVGEWLEESTRRMMLARRQSNFYPQMFSAEHELVTFGTTAVFAEEIPIPRRGGFGGLSYRAYPIGTYVIDENKDGLVDVFQREFGMTARAAAQKWDAKNLTEDMKKAITDNQGDKSFAFLHSIHPREEFDSERRDSQNKPVSSVVLAKDGQGQKIIAEGGFEEFPVMVPRWEQTVGEAFGRGRGHVALPDAKTLNRLVELELMGLEISIVPPIIVKSEGVIGNISFVPGKSTIVRDSVDQDIGTFKVNPRLDLSTIQKEDLKTSIRNQFFVNLLIQRSGVQPLTATEVLERIQEQQRIIGPGYGRLESELLDPMVDREFGIMLRAGALPPPPPEVIEAHLAGEAQIDVQYEGPLARAQRSQNVPALQRVVELIGLASPLAPDVNDIVDWDEAVRETAIDLGLPMTYLRDPKTVELIRRVRAEAQQQQQSIDNIQEGLKAAGAGAPALELLEGRGVAA